jgi:hypothetical protein
MRQFDLCSGVPANNAGASGRRLRRSARRDILLDPDGVNCLVYRGRGGAMLLLTCPCPEYVGRGLGTDAEMRDGEPLVVALPDFDQTGFARAEPIVNLI